MMGSKLLAICLPAGLVIAFVASAWAANPGDVIITEIMYNPNSPEGTFPALTEWVEIYNTTDAPVDLTGWWLGDEDGRSGDFESFTLPPRGIAVIIPVGNTTSSNPPGLLTKAQFADAWGTPVDKLIQPTSTNDQSGIRPSNPPEGGIAGGGLSNSPLNNGDPSDDLENTPLGGCPYGQAACVTTGADNEVLILVDATGQLIDKVVYDDQGDWPSDSPDGSSIMLDETKLDALSNDFGSSWIKAVAGERRARRNIVTAPFTGNDVGSPGEIQGITLDNQPPSAIGQTVWTVPGGSWDVTLRGSDDGAPDPPAALTYIVTSLPANGTLLDVGSSTAITTVPYTLPGGANVVRYTSTGPCGGDAFEFKVSDSALESATARVDVLVQCGDVIITEIMYNPASNENSPKVTEWVEVHNTTAAPIDVSGWYLIDRDGRSGDWPAGTIIPAYGVAVVIPQGTVGTRFMDAAQFRAAWDGYDIPIIIQPMTGAGWSNEIAGNGLANDPPSGGEQLRLVDATGKVQDIASYDNSFPWPGPTGESSIFLTEGNYTAAANDLGSNWANSRNCAGGAYGCLIGGFFDATDFGSPGFLAGVTAPTGNVPPTPLWQRVGVPMNTPATITLTACDDGNPVGGPVSYTITGLPSHGTLKDPGSGSDIITVPYVLTNNGNQVVYTPAADYTSVLTDLGGPGDDSFTFAVNDGAKPSRSEGTVRLIVQKGGLIITEVMYNPNNQPDNAWEWIEIANVSGADVYLDRITDDDTSATSRVIAYIGQTIPAGQVRIIAPSEPVGRTNDDFLAEWAVAPASQLDPALVVFVDLFNNTWAALDNAGDRLQLVGFDGVNYVLLDDIIYTNNAPWPVSNNQASIYLKYGEYDAVSNDLGENWALSVAGTDNAYATPETPGDPTDSDVGSPLLGPLPGCAAPPQDTDGDGDVDVNDFAVFQACFNGAANPYPPLSPDFLRKCICVDHDTDGDVDVNDFAVFQVCFNGSGNPPSQPACDLANSPS